MSTTGHEVRTHTRRTASGKTVTVRQHSREGDAAAPVDAPLDEKDQDRRDSMEVRVLKERQAARRGGTTARPAGEKRKRRPKAVTKAKSRARKAKRLWRRHKVKAIGYGLLALGGLGAYGVRRGSARAWKFGSRVVKNLRR